VVEYENSIGIEFRLVPPGKFKMGDPGDGADVTLTKPFHRTQHLLQAFQNGGGGRLKMVRKDSRG
jgi:hypothetical protein